jgi:hypothetical protein
VPLLISPHPMSLSYNIINIPPLLINPPTQSDLLPLLSTHRCHQLNLTNKLINRSDLPPRLSTPHINHQCLQLLYLPDLIRSLSLTPHSPLTLHPQQSLQKIECHFQFNIHIWQLIRMSQHMTYQFI